MSATEPAGRRSPCVRARGLVTVAFVTALSLTPHGARAQTARGPSAAEQTAAQALFDQAEQLLAEARVTEACPKLEESQRLDPAPGTLLNLARCYEASGKLASAWKAYREGAGLAERGGRPEWAALGARHAAALDARVPRLLVRVATPGAEVTVNGAPIAPSEWGLAIPMNPGPLRVEAHGAGKRPWSRDVAVAEGDHVVVDVGPLEDETLTPAPSALEGTAMGEVAPAPGPPQEGQPNAARRIAAIVAGGLGAVGLGFGAWFGVEAIQKKNDAQSLCPARRACSDAAAHDGDSARSAATASTAAFVIGGGLLALGALVYVTAPQDRAIRRGGATSSWRVAVFPAGVAVDGSF